MTDHHLPPGVKTAVPIGASERQRLHGRKTMHPDDRGTLWHLLAAVLAVLILTWLLVPSLQPGVAFLFAVWLLLTAWMFTKG